MNTHLVRVIGVVAALAALGCKGDGRTMLVVEVGTNLTVPAELTKIEIVVKKAGMVRQKIPFSLLGAYTLPVRAGLIAVDDPRGAELEISAIGYRGDEIVLAEDAVVAFVEGRSVLLRLYLARECRMVACRPEQTCSNGGSCRSRLRAYVDLPPFDPKRQAENSVPLLSAVDAQAPTPRMPDAAAIALPPPAVDAPPRNFPAPDGPTPGAMDTQVTLPSLVDTALIVLPSPGVDATPRKDPPPDVAPDSPMAIDVAPTPARPGDLCKVGFECASGFCADGICCESACTSLCVACNLPGSMGSCRPIPSGADPRNVCAVDPPSGCGRDGSCDGVGGCKIYSVGTICSPQSCTAGSVATARTCDGAGSCRPTTAQPCAPYTCNANACGTICSTTADCAQGAYCVAGACMLKLPNGMGCGTGEQCDSGFCTDGVCCVSSACGSPSNRCFTCGRGTNGAQPGTCQGARCSLCQCDSGNCHC